MYLLQRLQELQIIPIIYKLQKCIFNNHFEYMYINKINKYGINIFKLFFTFLTFHNFKNYCVYIRFNLF